jgi:diaphanous 1
MQQSEGDTTDEDDGTAKLRNSSNSPGRTAGSGSSPDWKGTFSQHRLTSLFDGFWGSTSPPSPSRPSLAMAPQRMNVSEPTLVSHHTGNTLPLTNTLVERPEEGTEDRFDSTAFEQMLV